MIGSVSRSVLHAPDEVRCCPRFDPRPWDGREIVWTDRPFVKERIHCVLHVPLDFRTKLAHARARIAEAGVAPSAPLVLVEHLSPWGCNVYLDVTGPVPDAEMASLSGTFLTKVFEGARRDEPRFALAMAAYVAARGRLLTRLYFGYPTCTACEKAYGESHVVMFGRVAVTAQDLRRQRRRSGDEDEDVARDGDAPVGASSAGGGARRREDG